MDAARVGLLVTFFTYLFLLIVVGAFSGRRVAGQSEEFYLAGRRLPGWLVSFSAGAAGESGWVMMGLVGAGYTAGVGTFWILPGCVLGLVFNIVWLGPRLRAALKVTVRGTGPVSGEPEATAVGGLLPGRANVMRRTWPPPAYVV